MLTDVISKENKTSIFYVKIVCVFMNVNMECDNNICSIYRVIHKSLRDVRLLRYSSRDGHAEVEHVNRGRDTPSFCSTLQVLDIPPLGDVSCT
jgi:hypothetical protein